MKFQTCPRCGKTMADIGGHFQCLYCAFVQEDKKEEESKEYYALKTNIRIAEQAHENLLNNIDGSMDYCTKKRGITRNTIEKWNLGYAPEGFRLMPQQWGERIIFPIRSNDGAHIIGFGGRKTTADDRAKYLNSPASPWYNKSASLYGYSDVPEGADCIFLCEGYVDVLSMFAFGFFYPVASLGTALTQQQASLIRKKAQTVCIAYDSDEPGRRNALRAAKLLLKAGFKAADIRMLLVSDAKDVDEALQHGCTLCDVSYLEYLISKGEWDAYIDACI